MHHLGELVMKQLKEVNFFLPLTESSISYRRASGTRPAGFQSTVIEQILPYGESYQVIGFPVLLKIILVLCYSIIFSSKEPACQCRRCKRHSFNLWVGKIPWRRAWQPSSLSWGVPWTEEPGEL